MSPFAARRLLNFAAAALALAASAGCATTAIGTADSRSRDIATLTRQADAWDKAIVRKDVAAIEANMADDFRQIDGAGDIEDKASFVAGVVSAKLVIDPYTVDEFEIRLYGDAALLSGRTRMTGRYNDKPFVSHYRYIDVYARRDGVWKIVSVQITGLRT